jgi:hypothetical protein
MFLGIFISNSLREKEEEANKFVKVYGLIS